MTKNSTVKKDVDIADLRPSLRLRSALARAVSSNVAIAPRIHHGFTFCLL